MLKNTTPEAGLPDDINAASTPVASLMMSNALTIALAVVPDSNDRVVTPRLPAISRVTLLTIELVLNHNMACCADCVTLISTPIQSRVPKFAPWICSELMALATTPLVM